MPFLLLMFFSVPVWAGECSGKIVAQQMNPTAVELKVHTAGYLGTRPIGHLRISPNGEWLAAIEQSQGVDVVGKKLLPGGLHYEAFENASVPPDRMTLWQTNTKSPENLTPILKLTDIIGAGKIEFSPDSKSIAIAHSGGAKVFREEGGRWEPLVNFVVSPNPSDENPVYKESVDDISWSPDGNRLMVLKSFDTRAPLERHSTDRNFKSDSVILLNGVAGSPRDYLEELGATKEEIKEVRKIHKKVRDYFGLNRPVPIKFRDQRVRLVEIFDVKNMKCLLSLSGEKLVEGSPLYTAQWIPNSNWVGFGMETQAALLNLDSETLFAYRSLNRIKHDYALPDLKFYSYPAVTDLKWLDGERVISASTDRSVKVWKTAASSQLGAFYRLLGTIPHELPLRALDASGNTLASLTSDPNLETGAWSIRLTPLDGPNAYSPSLIIRDGFGEKKPTALALQPEGSKSGMWLGFDEGSLIFVPL